LRERLIDAALSRAFEVFQNTFLPVLRRQESEKKPRLDFVGWTANEYCSFTTAFVNGKSSRRMPSCRSSHVFYDEDILALDASLRHPAAKSFGTYLTESKLKPPV